MRPKEAIRDLWKKNFFEGNLKSNKEIESQIMNDYGITTSNISAILNNCKEFLIKKGNGWTQRNRYNGISGKKGKYIDYFTLLNIHPKVLKASKKLFLDGHYSDAIFNAFKQVEILVKEKSEIEDKSGTKLMQHVFSPQKPILKLNDGFRVSDKDEQEGFMMLFAGASEGIRNPLGHDNKEQKDQKITIQYIAFASLLCWVVDRSLKA